MLLYLAKCRPFYGRFLSRLRQERGQNRRDVTFQIEGIKSRRVALLRARLTAACSQSVIDASEVLRRETLFCLRVSACIYISRAPKGLLSCAQKLAHAQTEILANKQPRNKIHQIWINQGNSFEIGIAIKITRAVRLSHFFE